MRLFDALRGKTKQLAPNLDQIFALSTAALTLQSELDLVTTGEAGLCFKGGSGASELSNDAEIHDLLLADDPNGRLTLTTDSLGFKWVVISDTDIPSLVTRLHGANTTLTEHGFGPRLLCAVFGFQPLTPPGEGNVRLVYLFKQGTFYPFAPRDHNKRDNEFELRVRTFIGDDLPMEKDLSRWMALWGLPVS